MAKFGDILSNICIETNQTIRRNSNNTAFEAFTPFTGNTYTQSGITVITKRGDNINIYVPPDSITGITWNAVTNKPDLYTEAEINNYTGKTNVTIIALTDLSGLTTTAITGATNGLIKV